MKKSFKRAIVILLCIFAALLSFAGPLDCLITKIGSRALAQQNDEYLTTAFNHAMVGFGTMSVIKAGLDIIEGSEVGLHVGVTANLQVGDIVQPAYDYVDIAWRTILTGCVALLSIRYLLQAAAVLDGYLLGVTLLLAAGLLTVRWCKTDWMKLRSLLHDILGVTAVITIALYFILPFSVWGAAKLSRVITQPAIAEAQEGFEETKQTLFPDELQSPKGVLTKLKQIGERIEQIAAYLYENSRNMVIWSIKLITGYIFDCIVFPIGFFILFLWLTRAVMRYLFHKNLQTSIIDDLARILIDRQHRAAVLSEPSVK